MHDAPAAKDLQSAPEPLQADGTATTARLCVQGAMTLARAVELRDAAIAALERQTSPVEFDLSDVTELDSAGVQILLFAKCAAEARNKQLLLVGQSSVVLRTLELLRLDAHFGRPAFFLFDEASP